MKNFEVLKITPQMIEDLKARLLNFPKVFSLKSNIEYSSWLVSYGIAREVGTINDELSRFVFDSTTGSPICRESLRAEMVRYKDKIGFRIESSESGHLEVRIKGFRTFVHPGFSENADGSYHQIVIFPEIAAKIAELEGIELVVVKPWALNSIFGGFSSTEEYYATNFWELETNDSTLFADLLQERKIALLGTHDLIAHVSGLAREAWEALPRQALEVSQAIQRYLGNDQVTVPDLVLPYTAGVLLDDLAQPPTYGSRSHLTMLCEVLKVLSAKKMKTKNKMLLKYPSAFEEVIRLSRDHNLTQGKAQRAIQKLVSEINEATLQVPVDQRI